MPTIIDKLKSYPLLKDEDYSLDRLLVEAVAEFEKQKEVLDKYKKAVNKIDDYLEHKYKDATREDIYKIISALTTSVAKVLKSRP